MTSLAWSLKIRANNIILEKCMEYYFYLGICCNFKSCFQNLKHFFHYRLYYVGCKLYINYVESLSVMHVWRVLARTDRPPGSRDLIYGSEATFKLKLIYNCIVLQYFITPASIAEAYACYIYMYIFWPKKSDYLPAMDRNWYIYMLPDYQIHYFCSRTCHFGSYISCLEKPELYCYC